VSRALVLRSLLDLFTYAVLSNNYDEYGPLGRKYPNGIVLLVESPLHAQPFGAWGRSTGQSRPPSSAGASRRGRRLPQHTDRASRRRRRQRVHAGRHRGVSHFPS
jgi:hypothetical protein